MRYLRYFALVFFGFIHHPEGWRLARKWDAEADEPRKRRMAAIAQLGHEVKKVRDGGYWRKADLCKPGKIWPPFGPLRYIGKDCYRWTPR